MVEIGTKLNQLTVIGFEGKRSGQVVCLCDCGETCKMKKAKFESGHTKSCGCRKYKFGKNKDYLIGQTFSHLTVVRQMEGTRTEKISEWECLCSCGKTYITETSYLLSGRIKSCGCQKGLVDGHGAMLTHGLTKHPKYTTWCHIKERCIASRHKNFNNYGGRGISVEEPWLSDAKSFIDWYESNCNGDYSLQVNRIDNNGNYSPANCRLSTSKRNNNNRGNNKIIEYKGSKYTMAEIVEQHSVVEYSCFQLRIKNGWDVELALTTKPNEKESTFYTSVRQRLWYRHRNMRDRCNNPKNHNYVRYGLRGIYVSEAWKDVEDFISWSIENGFEPNLSLDRIDNDGPYSPENCRWVSSLVQAGNK